MHISSKSYHMCPLGPCCPDPATHTVFTMAMSTESGGPLVWEFKPQGEDMECTSMSKCRRVLADL